MILNKLENLRKDLDVLIIHRDIIRKNIKSSTEVEEQLKYKADLYQKCSEIVKVWLEDSLQKNIDSVSELATQGLHHIIDDQNLIFKIKQEPKYNRLAMNFIIENDGIEGDPIDSFGGGAVMIISLVMRLAIMARMKMGNLLLLDESLASLANKYVPACASFMRRLSEEIGINILIVTHNDEFLQYAHMSYEGEKTSDGKLSLKKRVFTRT